MNANNRKKKISDPLDDTGVAGIFSHLQQHPDTPQSRRVESLLDLLVLLGGVRLGKADKANALARLRAALDRYRFRVQVFPTKQGIQAVYLSARGASTDEQWEYAAVNELLDLLKHEGALARLRRCETCEGWLFALRRSDQKFCSDACRQYLHDNHPEKKTKRLARLRKNYAEDKVRAENAKRRVGYRTR